MWKSSVIVGCGGAVGAAARYAVAMLITVSFPLETLLVNILGCFLLGYLTSLFAKKKIPAQLLLLLGTGFCGGFTTFSTFSSEIVYLFQSSAPLAFAYMMVSAVLGISATVVGMKIGIGKIGVQS